MGGDRPQQQMSRDPNKKSWRDVMNEATKETTTASSSAATSQTCQKHSTSRAVQEEHNRPRQWLQNQTLDFMGHTMPYTPEVIPDQNDHTPNQTVHGFLFDLNELPDVGEQLTINTSSQPELTLSLCFANPGEEGPHKVLISKEGGMITEDLAPQKNWRANPLSWPDECRGITKQPATLGPAQPNLKRKGLTYDPPTEPHLNPLVSKGNRLNTTKDVTTERKRIMTMKRTNVQSGEDGRKMAEMGWWRGITQIPHRETDTQDRREQGAEAETRL